MNVALKILEKKALGKLHKDKRSINSDNPYEEWVEYADKNGKTKRKKRERPIPAGLSRNDAKILRKVRKRAYRWDQGFRCCCFGFRFGWSAIIGLIPVVGDAIEVLMSLAMIKSASKVDGGLPKRLYSMMVTNIIIDFATGFVPLIGDLVDVFYRANTRNAWLLDAYLSEKAKALREGALQDPDTGKKIRVPSELQVAPGDRDVEQGVDSMVMTEPARSTPAAVPPARTPAPRGNAPPPSASRTATTPGRSLTGQRPGGGPWDPRDR